MHRAPGIELPYLVSNDGALDAAGSDPQVLYLLVPMRLADLPAVEFGAADGNDSPELRAPGLDDGFLLYIAIADLPHADVIAALLADLLLPDPDDAGFGDVVLTVGTAVCAPGVEVPDLTEAGRAAGELPEDGQPAVTPPACGNQQAPAHVYSFDVAEPGGTLTASLDNPGTEISGVLEVRRFCELPESALVCGPGEVVLPEADAGRWVVLVEAARPGGTLRLLPIAFDGPGCNVAARNDLGAAGFSDGCNDAFDGFGQVRLTADGASAQLDVRAGTRQVALGPRIFTVQSELVGQDLWRLVVLGDGGPVDVSIGGNLGSDGSTRYYPQVAELDGFELPYLVSNDGALDSFASDPQLFYLLAPRYSAELAGVTYTAVDGSDVPVIAGQALTPAFAFYLAIGDVPHADVMAAVAADLRIDEPDLPAAGDYELTVEWAPGAE